MAFDFGLLIVVIIMVLCTILSLVKGGAIYGIINVPLTIYLIIRIQAIDSPTLPTIGLAAFALFNAILVYANWHRED